MSPIAAVSNDRPGPAAAPSIPLVAQLGSEVAESLSSALERVLALAATGRIDRPGLRALHDEIARARHAAIVGQQLARLGAGSVIISNERLDLPALLHAAVAQRLADMDERGIELRERLVPAMVNSDPALLFTLLQSLLDWSFEHAAGRIELSVSQRPGQALTGLVCRLPHTAPDTVDSEAMPLDAVPAGLETLSWRLLVQSADLLDLRLTREDDPRYTVLSLGFPDMPASPPTRDELRLATDFAAVPAAPPSTLAGLQVLVLSARRELRSAVREALRPLAVLVDARAGLDEALAFCREGLPHVVLHDDSCSGSDLAVLRAAMPESPQTPVCIGLVSGRVIDIHRMAGHSSLSVGTDALHTALPLALRLAVGPAT